MTICIARIPIWYAKSLPPERFDVVAIADVDTLWLGPVPDEDFWFASLEENPVSFENRDVLKRKIKFLKQYLKIPGDKRKVLFPMGFRTGSQPLADLDSVLGSLMTGSEWPSDITDWDHIMSTCKDVINRHGLRSYSLEPEICSAVPWYWRSKPIQPESVKSGFTTYVCNVYVIVPRVTLRVCRDTCNLRATVSWRNQIHAELSDTQNQTCYTRALHLECIAVGVYVL